MKRENAGERWWRSEMRNEPGGGRKGLKRPEKGRGDQMMDEIIGHWQKVIEGRRRPENSG